MSRTSIDWSHVTPEIIERYGGQAPRYTSYPTAPEWRSGFGADEYRAALSRADSRPEEPLSIYVHIPFCRRRCRFCGCATHIAADDSEHEAYLEAVEAELETVADLLPNRRSMSQLHWGGGTPTTLDVSNLKRLHAAIVDRFEPTEDAEISIEIAPAHTSVAQLETLAALGFNRISMGVQDFTPAVQEAVGRPQPYVVTETLVETARDLGMREINLDLMYGLPLQDLESWRTNLETAIELRPDRLAVFGYAHVPWMRPHQKELEIYALPGEKLRFDLYKEAHERLLRAGYVHIGMDHFARPEDSLSRALEDGRLSRNFQGYTVARAFDLLGFGATSIGDVGGAFVQNNPKIADYDETVRDGRLATVRGHATNAEDRLRRFVIVQLMCNLNLNLDVVGEEFGISFHDHFESEMQKLRHLERDGLVDIETRRIHVTPIGRLFVRQVGLVFDAYSGEGSGARFSRTV